MADQPTLVKDRTGLADLPVELLCKICSNLSTLKLLDEKPKADKHQLVQNSTYSLNSFCHVSRLFYQVGMPYLYQVVHADPRSIVPLMTTLSERPDLASLVQQLYISFQRIDRKPLPEHLAIYRAQPEFIRPDMVLVRFPQWNYEPRVEDIISFRENVLMLIFRTVCHLEVLDLRVGIAGRYSNAPRTLKLPVQSLDNLRELRLENREGLSYIAEYAYLFQMAPKLVTLAVTGEIRAVDLFEESMSPYMKGIRILKLNRTHRQDLTDLIHEFEGLTELFYSQIRDWSRYASFDRQVDTIAAGLSKHKDSLKTLQLEIMSSSTRINEYPVCRLETLKDYRCLEDLRISSNIFIHGLDSAGESPTCLLEELPTSIRRLNILYPTYSVEPQLISLAKAHGRGSYPNLEEITLRDPWCKALEFEPAVLELKKCCRLSGLRLLFGSRETAGFAIRSKGRLTGGGHGEHTLGRDSLG